MGPAIYPVLRLGFEGRFLNLFADFNFILKQWGVSFYNTPTRTDSHNLHYFSAHKSREKMVSGLVSYGFEGVWLG